MGGISKCGDALMRETLFEAALVLMTHSRKWSWLKAWGVKIARRVTRSPTDAGVGETAQEEAQSRFAGGLGPAEALDVRVARSRSFAIRAPTQWPRKIFQMLRRHCRSLLLRLDHAHRSQPWKIMSIARRDGQPGSGSAANASVGAGGSKNLRPSVPPRGSAMTASATATSCATCLRR
jgi:hypothetical protein